MSIFLRALNALLMIFLPVALGVFLWHALIDGVAVFAVGTVGPYWTEAIIAVFALVNLFLIFAFRSGDAASPAPSST